MKKILIATILLISFITNGNSKVFSIECKEVNLTLFQGQSFEDLKNKKNYQLYISDKSSTLIIEPEFKNNENNTIGRITFIHDEMIKYFYISDYSYDFINNKPSRFNAYNYSKLTKEDAKNYKSLKPFVGKFKENSFLTFDQVKTPLATPFYNLNSYTSMGLYSVDTREYPIRTLSEKFICKD